MILICPNCAKRYRLAPGSIGPAGRQVRCHACGQAWHAIPDSATPPPPAPPPPLAAPPQRAGADLPPVPPPLPPPAPSAPPASSRLPAIVAWLGVAVLVAIAAGAWLGRGPLVAAVPAMARYYQGLGIDVAAAPALEIRNQTSERAQEGNREVLVVRGEIHNPARDARDVPAVRVALLDGRGQEVAFALADALASRLEPGAATRFDVTIPEPPAAAETYRVTLEHH